jgi:hypothetical protein
VSKPMSRQPAAAPIGGEPPANLRRLRANHDAKPIWPPPSAATIGDDPAKSPDRRSARATAKPTASSRSVEPIGHVHNDVAAGDGQITLETQVADAIAGTVTRIVELQRVRKFCIKSQSRCDRSIEQFIASQFGNSPDLDEKARKEIFRRASAMRLSIEKGGEDHECGATHHSSALSALSKMILASAASRAVWDLQRQEAEKLMEKLAKSLPIWEWTEKVRGLGAKGLAIIIGEAGIPIGEYRTVSGLWMRLGLAVINGQAQGRRGGELALQHRFSPARRAEVWAVCSDSLFRAQWRGDKDEDGKDPKKTGKSVAVHAHPIGPYGEVYAKRRAATASRIVATEMSADGEDEGTSSDKWTKGRCHNDARRVMTKELIKDLWVEWRRAA